jgi:L-rhamnose mutarotase
MTESSVRQRFGSVVRLRPEAAAEYLRLHEQRWWELTAPCQEQLAGTPSGLQWAPMAQVWHLD